MTQEEVAHSLWLLPRTRTFTVTFQLASRGLQKGYFWLKEILGGNLERREQENWRKLL